MTRPFRTERDVWRWLAVEVAEYRIYGLAWALEDVRPRHIRSRARKRLFDHIIMPRRVAGDGDYRARSLFCLLMALECAA